MTLADTIRGSPRAIAHVVLGPDPQIAWITAANDGGVAHQRLVAAIARGGLPTRARLPAGVTELELSPASRRVLVTPDGNVELFAAAPAPACDADSVGLPVSRDDGGRRSNALVCRIDGQPRQWAEIAVGESRLQTLVAPTHDGIASPAPGFLALVELARQGALDLTAIAAPLEPDPATTIGDASVARTARRSRPRRTRWSIGSASDDVHAGRVPVGDDGPRGYPARLRTIRASAARTGPCSAAPGRCRARRGCRPAP